MKKFLEFLNEMSLKSYRHDFKDRAEREEGFHTDPNTGRRDLGNQTYTDKGRQRSITDRFSQKDRIVITHPRTFRRLEERLGNSEFDLNILLIEHRRAESGLGSSRQLKDYEDQVEEFMRTNGIQREGRVTFVKNATSGHVLTPWMILHTLGHALTETDGRANNRIKDSVHMIARRINPDSNLYPGTETWMKRQRETIGSVFQFASASLEGQHNSTASPSELAHELIAEFLWNGDRIRIKPPHHEDPEIVRWVKHIERDIRDMLRANVGRIIYDYT